MYILNKYREKYLLVLAGTFFITFLLIPKFIKLDTVVKSNDIGLFSQNFTFNLFVLIVLLVSPIIEEIAFRGSFSKTNFINKISLPILVVILLFKFNYLSIIILLILLITKYYKNKRQQSYTLKFLSIFLSISLFVISHYSFENTFRSENLNTIILYSSLVCLFLWITININIWYSIATHFLYNFLVVAMILIQIQFTKHSIYIKSNDIDLSLEQKPYYSKYKNIEFIFEENQIKCNDCTLDLFISELGIENKPLTTPFSTYDIILVNNNELNKEDFIKRTVDEMAKLKMISIE